MNHITHIDRFEGATNEQRMAAEKAELKTGLTARYMRMAQPDYKDVTQSACDHLNAAGNGARCQLGRYFTAKGSIKAYGANGFDTQWQDSNMFELIAYGRSFEEAVHMFGEFNKAS